MSIGEVMRCLEALAREEDPLPPALAISGRWPRTGRLDPAALVIELVPPGSGVALEDIARELALTPIRPTDRRRRPARGGGTGG